MPNHWRALQKTALLRDRIYVCAPPTIGPVRKVTASPRPTASPVRASKLSCKLHPQTAEAGVRRLLIQPALSRSRQLPAGKVGIRSGLTPALRLRTLTGCG